MSRVDQTSRLIQHNLAEIIIGEIESPNFLITISRVKCSPDLSMADIYISVLPNNFSGTALKKMRAKSGLLAKIIKGRAYLTKTPRLQFFIDEDLKKMDEIDEILEIIKKEDKE